MSKNKFAMPSRVEEPTDKIAPDVFSKRRVVDTFVMTGDIQRATKKQISLGITPDLLAQIDECAASLSMSRAAFICAACSLAVKNGLRVGK